MPIYSYRCQACGFTKDALQKISDAPLTVCPSCNKDTFQKQLTAAGFQLKGTGWYATDFRGGSSAGKPAEPTPESGGSDAAAAPAAPSTDSSTPTSSASTPDAAAA